MDKFKKFLNSLKTESNEFLVECVLEGYQAIFETPVVVVKDTPIDFFVELVSAFDGHDVALDYINDTLEKIKRKQGIIEIPHTKDGYINRVDVSMLNNLSPKDEREIPELIRRLESMRKMIKEQISDLVPA